MIIVGPTFRLHFGMRTEPDCSIFPIVSGAYERTNERTNERDLPWLLNWELDYKLSYHKVQLKNCICTTLVNEPYEAVGFTFTVMQRRVTSLFWWIQLFTIMTYFQCYIHWPNVNGKNKIILYHCHHLAGSKKPRVIAIKRRWMSTY